MPAYGKRHPELSQTDGEAQLAKTTQILEKDVVATEPPRPFFDAQIRDRCSVSATIECIDIIQVSCLPAHRCFSAGEFPPGWRIKIRQTKARRWRQRTMVWAAEYSPHVEVELVHAESTHRVDGMIRYAVNGFRQ